MLSTHVPLRWSGLCRTQLPLRCQTCSTTVDRMADQERLNVYIPKTLKARVRKLAQMLGISEAAAVRIALDEALTARGIR